MLKVECESCKAPYQVDERRVPPTGLKMRCPKCGHTFIVSDPSKGGAPAGGALPKPIAKGKATMVGLAPKPPPSSAKTRAGTPIAPPSTPSLAPSTDFDIGLPAVQKPPSNRDAGFGGSGFGSKAPSFGSKAPSSSSPSAPLSAPPSFPGLDDLDLPALADDIGLPAPAGRPVSRAGQAKAPAAKAAPAAPASPFSFDVDVPAVVPSLAPSGGGFGAIDLPASRSADASDLPAVKGGAFGELGDLPASKARAGFGSLPVPKSGSGFGDLPAPKVPGLGDLPTAKVPGLGDLPAAKVPGLGDLPSPKGGIGKGGVGDLPLAKPGGAPTNLPVAKAPPAPAKAPPAAAKAPPGIRDLPAAKGPGHADLPVAQRGGGGSLPTLKGGGGFGEIDLPSLQNDLPLYGSAHLPSLSGADAHLPSPMGASAHLPSLSGAEAHLPSLSGAEAHLPSPMGANAHLPSPMGADAHLPIGMDLDAHMPSALSDDRFLPKNKASGSMSFGELDLPLVDSDEPPLVPPRTSGMSGGFGEVDLPSDAGPSFAPPRSPSIEPSEGNMAFGEVDLGGPATDSVAPLGPPPAATGGGSFAFQEASLDASNGGSAEVATGVPARLRGASTSSSSSRVPKIAGIALALVVVGGAALQLTPLGAFGYVWIGDKLHASENIADASAKGDIARAKLANDTFGAAQEAADELFEARRRSPRSRPLGAYAAFVEYMNQIRFGGDPARAAKVNAFVNDVPVNTEVNYLAAAQAAQAAQAADWAKAKGALENAIAIEPKDGIQHELSILKGEIALAQKDPTSALAAFNAAHASGSSARTSFGIARASYMAKAFPKARQAVDDTLKASPKHAGALTMRAELVWEASRDDAASMADLAAVLDPANRKNLGSADLGGALAAKGWILFARDRAGDARAAFDEAVKVDPRNVSALIGQGEVLYADGRNTEALTRFDDALAKDAANISALLGSAKSKVALERLADAKAQLTVARHKAPKDMNVALWLARTEEALGNSKAANELYGAAVDLADPKNPEAVQAYAAYARYLAAQGKNAEAAAKLEQARTKLPDSAALQRAIGEVAVAQGQFAEALEHFEAALAKNPNDLGTRFRLGVTYRRMHKLDLAAKALDEVAAVDKEYPGIALERGLLFEESGDLQKALEQFKSASQKAPNDIDLKLRVGAAYVAIGEVDTALTELLKVRDSRPNSAEANHFLGRAYLKQGGLESVQAMRYLQRAVALDPNKAEYHLYVAWAANEATPAQLGLARTHIDKALALDKLLADAYWQRGVLLRKEGQVNDAIVDLKRALQLKPSRHEAHADLAEAYEDRNEVGVATAEWQRAIAGDDKRPYWRYKLGKILADKGQNGEAARHLVYAVEQGKSAQPRPGWLSSASFEAGEVLRKTGQKKDACEHYRLFMELAPSTSPDMRDAARAQRELACPETGP